MTDENKKATLDKPLDLNRTTTSDGLTQFGAKPSIHSRIAGAAKVREEQAKQQASLGGTKFINFSRLFIFPDISGSMDGLVDDSERSYATAQRSGHRTTKLDMLKKAVDEYLNNCSPIANAVGVASFPEGAFATPSYNFADIRAQVNALEPTGSTPMAEALGYCLETEQFSHGVLISDGSPDNRDEVIELAKQYKAKNITIDAVHIGADKSGEELMRSVAEITGGAYIKFTDVTSFAKSFSYLAPAKRSILNASKNPIALLGAAEIKL